MKKFGLTSASIGIVAILGMLQGCAIGSREQLLMSQERFDELGQVSWEQLTKSMPRDYDAHNNRYVRCVTDQLMTGLEGDQAAVKWEVQLFNNARPAVFALPGGKLGVNSGILKVVKNQHQLAAIIGHELGHLRHGHGNERIVTNISSGEHASLADTVKAGDSFKQQRILALMGAGPEINVILPFSRRQESEADLYSLELMANAGFDPRESVAAWKNLQALGNTTDNPYLATHPVSERRLFDLNRTVEVPLAQYGRVRATGVNPKCR